METEVNKEARKERHRRIFSRSVCLICGARNLLSKIPTGLQFIKRLIFGIPNAAQVLAEEAPASIINIPFFQKSIFFSIVMFLFASFTPSGYFLDSGFAADYLPINEEDYLINSRFYDVEFITTEEGYLLKQEPQTGEINRIGMKDMVVHTVETGETMSSIAAKYGVKAETIMWENDLYDANRLKVGQKLYIPPLDGVTYTVLSGDTLNKIAAKFKVDEKAIVEHNKLQDSQVQKGKTLFIPGAKPLLAARPPVAAGKKPGTTTGKGYVEKEATIGTSSVPEGESPFIFPTTGTLTQGFKRGHYAVDIGNRSKPPIWAAGAGTVIKASVGTYGGGYGNHVVIDHGGGLTTLYGHMEEVYVTEGTTVSQGQVIGKMGKTGRVYGPTGIHLHFEVIKNGVKQNPPNYY